jgi:hypothetical protein
MITTAPTPLRLTGQIRLHTLDDAHDVTRFRLMHVAECMTSSQLQF